VKRQDQRAPKVEGVADQAVRSLREEPVVATAAGLLGPAAALPLAKPHELLEVPRRPEKKRNPERLHAVEEPAGPTGDAEERRIRKGVDVEEHGDRRRGRVRREQQPVICGKRRLPHHPPRQPLVPLRDGQAVKDGEDGPGEHRFRDLHARFLPEPDRIIAPARGSVPHVFAAAVR
jgi:hypothetical protein